MSMPDGTLTFLFTDIEGSSHLWESDPAGMKASLVLHDVVLIQEIKAHKGESFKRVGDAFCAVFPSAVDALKAAVAIQLRMNEPPPEGMISLKVRMGLHTGIAEQREGDYFGPTVNRVARIMNLGHGGQVLLSQVSAGLCLDHLPTNIELLDVGEVTLKSMTRSERIFQVYTDQFPSVFPALRAQSGDIVSIHETSAAEFSREAEATQKILTRAQEVSGSSINRENLLRTAAELGISASAVAQAESEYRIAERKKNLRLQFFEEQRRHFLGKSTGVISLALLMTGIWALGGIHSFYWPIWVYGWFAIMLVSRGIKLIHDGPQLDERYEKWLIRREHQEKGLPIPKDIRVESDEDRHFIRITKDL